MRRARAPGAAATGRPADALGDRRDVRGRRAAAAADDADAVALDELLQRLGERLGLLGEDRLAVRSLQRQPGVGDARDRHRAELAEEADRVAHVLRAGRAVQADHVDLQRLERRQHRGDVGAEQHLAAVRAAARRRCGSAACGRALERLARAEDRRLDLEDVLRGLDDQQVGAAVDQPRGLLGEDLDQLAEADLPERGVLGGRQVAGRADRARDEAALAGRLARDLGGLRVDLDACSRPGPTPRASAATPGRCRSRGLPRPPRASRLCTPSITSGRLSTSASWHLPGKAAVVLAGQVELLERRAHAAVVDDDVARGSLQVVACHLAMLAVSQ